MADINTTSLVEVKYKNQTIASIGAGGDVTLDCNDKIMGDNIEVVVPAGTEGTPTATKSVVSNHAVTVTPAVTNVGGLISGSTKTGTAVTVSASELVSGSETKTANGTYDVTNLASLVVSVPVWDGSYHG